MRGLFFKIFVIFWIAQSLIFVVSTALLLHRRFPDIDILFDSLYSSLNNEAKESVNVYESEGCEAFQAFAIAHNDTLLLEDDSGSRLCQIKAGPMVMPEPLVRDHINGAQVGAHYFWSVPTVSATGKKYIFFLSRPHVRSDPRGFRGLARFAFPQMPVAIAVGGATTFVLVLLFTRPLVKLRKAARSLAEGKLSTRVRSQSSTSQQPRGDEFQALIHDFDYMAERLESLVDAQKLLLRDVSHELRSPLARLSVALELAREDADPGMEMEVHLSRIEREAEKLNQLIGQLLTLSSIEAIQDFHDFKSVSINKVIDQLLADAIYEAKQRGCSVNFQADAECVISGDQTLLYRAIENIVRNAIRYTAERSVVEIRLSIEHEDNTHSAVLEVSDRGPGIPESEVRSIFRPFYRVDNSRSSETGGFGVGLAIAERTVKLHRGQIAAFNRQGGGTTVRMVFPLITRIKGNTVPRK